MSKSNVNMTDDMKKFFNTLYENTINTANEFKIQEIKDKIEKIKKKI